jgi:hypothetical protein
MILTTQRQSVVQLPLICTDPLHFLLEPLTQYTHTTTTRDSQERSKYDTLLSQQESPTLMTCIVGATQDVAEILAWISDTVAL